MNMDLFEPTPKDIWEKRSNWITKELDAAETGLSYLASEHSIALFYDIQRAYCAGAWISVVVMTVASVDSHFRETEYGDNKIGTAKLLKECFDNEEIEWLRKLRNKYVHMNLDESFLGIDTWFNNQEQLEGDATKAMSVAIKAFYLNPGT
jgi:hypothetical protein